MPIKDRVVSWYIQNVIIPRKEIIDKPGFILTTLSGTSQPVYLRDLFLPEQLLEIIENKIVQTYGDQGKQALYSTGKKFGFLYSSMSNFPTINTSSENDFRNFAYYLVQFVGGTYAQQATHNLDLEQKIFTLNLEDYIVCRHNGLGYIMTDGSIAGTWAYALQDKSIEGIQIECQGRGDKQCFVLCAPQIELQRQMHSFFCENNLTEQVFDNNYKKLNEIRKATFSKNSLNDLLNAGFFEYKRGILSYKNMRFFACDSHILYLLEQELTKLKDGEQLLFDVCAEFGKTLIETYGEKDYQKFISDFFPALGYGDILVMDSDKLQIGALYYPWSVFSDQSKYIIFRGMMSGIISSSLGKKIDFKEYDIKIGNYLTLSISI